MRGRMGGRGEIMAGRMGITNGTGLVALVLRLWLGYTWLAAGWPKVLGAEAPAWVGDRAGVAVAGFLKGALAKTGGDHPLVQPWYADFIRAVALPHATLFSYLVAYGELLVGLALLVGVFTRFATLMALMMTLSYLFAGSIGSNPQMLLAEAAVLFAGAAAGAYGLDRYLLPALAGRRGQVVPVATPGAGGQAVAVAGGD